LEKTHPTPLLFYFAKLVRGFVPHFFYCQAVPFFVWMQRISTALDIPRPLKRCSLLTDKHKIIHMEVL
jgi:hypothetical protein